MRIRGALSELSRSKHIHLALVSGASIIALAYTSKRLLSEPMDNLYVSAPALLVVAAEAALASKRRGWYTRTGTWLAAVALSTALIIMLHLI